MKGVDPKKLAIINHVDGPLLVIAGPGVHKSCLRGETFDDARIDGWFNLNYASRNRYAQEVRGDRLEDREPQVLQRESREVRPSLRRLRHEILLQLQVTGNHS